MKNDKLSSTPTELNTKFGKLMFNLSEEINFSEGIIGFANLKKYALLDFPTKLNLQNLKILQSLEDKAISFITLPILKNSKNLYSGMIAQADINQTCETLKIEDKNTYVLLILNIKKDSQNQVCIFANLKAPLFVDSQQLIGFQHILANNSYEISKKLEI